MLAAGTGESFTKTEWVPRVLITDADDDVAREDAGRIGNAASLDSGDEQTGRDATAYVRADGQR